MSHRTPRCTKNAMFSPILMLISLHRPRARKEKDMNEIVSLSDMVGWLVAVGLIGWVLRWCYVAHSFSTDYTVVFHGYTNSQRTQTHTHTRQTSSLHWSVVFVHRSSFIALILLSQYNVKWDSTDPIRRALSHRFAYKTHLQVISIFALFSNRIDLVKYFGLG